MRACFLGQNICALGFGVATLQMPPLVPEDDPGVRYGTEVPPPSGRSHASPHAMTRAARQCLPSPAKPSLPLVYAAPRPEMRPGATDTCVKPVKTGQNRE